MNKETGEPSQMSRRVKIGGAHAIDIRKRHHVISFKDESVYRGRANYRTITFCMEIPGKTVCGQCKWERGCGFSKA